MPIIEIKSLEEPGVEVFSTLTEAQLRNRLEPGKYNPQNETCKVCRTKCAEIKTKRA